MVGSCSFAGDVRWLAGFGGVGDTVAVGADGAVDDFARAVGGRRLTREVERAVRALFTAAGFGLIFILRLRTLGLGGSRSGGIEQAGEGRQHDCALHELAARKALRGVLHVDLTSE